MTPTPNRRDGHGDGRGRRKPDRAQAALPALVVAIVILASATVLAVSVADEARTAAERNGVTRGAAVTLADVLVGPEGPTTRRRNVLDREATLALSVGTVEDAVPAVRGRAFRIRIGGDAVSEWPVEERTILERGSIRGGERASRIALLARSENRTDRVHVDGETTREVSATARTAAVRVVSGNVTTVRVDDRMMLRRPDGLRGSATIDLPRGRAATVAFEGIGVVEMRIERERRTPVVVRVTVDG
ncbi:DUF7263 family protein [Halopenitus persicus]|uniref:Uncharacterized protein n=1 Tax=Halopenitus persicus TaxID=1048396 RepID=A0A1H3IH74_9EURY|nr:hypothetical protein [Halopenitus persicus]QHS17091.1 hypothetical protein GWK26_08010 [haloarchaeon 3A1-DGR]SDY26438.1 hypothetical protein SAMN05216564_104106 [Halopenitus persicus]